MGYDEQAAMLAPAPVQAKGGGGLGGFFSRLFGGGQRGSDGGEHAAQQPPAPTLTLSRNLSEGDRGPDVIQLQQELYSRGLYTGDFDGIFGKGTKLAVKRAQKAGGVAIDGIVGPNTLRVITEQPRAIPRAIVVDESSLEDRKKPKSGRRPKRSGGGIELKHAGFTVPTGKLYSAGVSDTALRVALAAYDVAWRGKQTRNTTFTLVDFTKSDDERRLFVMDLQSGEVIRAEFVSHGYGSDGAGYKNNPDQFSNVSGSGKSSLGLMRAGKMRKSAAKYRTKTDAREFDGLERGHNDKVRSRSIIMHAAISSKTGASYVNKNGVGGTSAGCWALDKDVNTAVIKAIPPGSLLFNYYPDKRYMETSNYLAEYRAKARQGA